MGCWLKLGAWEEGWGQGYREDGHGFDLPNVEGVHC